MTAPRSSPFPLTIDDLYEQGIPIGSIQIPANYLAVSGIRVVEGRRAERRVQALRRSQAKQQRRAQARAWRRRYPWSKRHPRLTSVLFFGLLAMVAVVFVLAP